MTRLVGVDAGASKTLAAVADESLRILARAAGPAAALQPQDTDAAAGVILDTVRRALGRYDPPREPDAVAVGAAGAGRESERAALESALRASLGSEVPLVVTTDAAVALEDAFPGGTPGILVIAGSGSVALARDADGREWRAGGLGWQLGDEGSGYALGRAALGAVGRAADSRGPSTGLSERLRAAIDAPSLDRLITWAQTADRRAVAGLARAVCDVAAAGDEVAGHLVRRSALDLAEHVAALVHHFPADETVTVALAGGLLSPGTPVRAATIAVLGGRFTRVTVPADPVDPTRGALRMAASLLA